MEDKLRAILDRFAAVEHSLNDPSLAADPARLRELSREHKALLPIADAARSYLRVLQQLDDARTLSADPSNEPSLRDLAFEEMKDLQSRLDEQQEHLRVLLLPRDPNDAKDCIVEIRAGTGGDEAALFGGDLFRMYQRYAELKGWSIDVIDMTPSERGGFKEITFEVKGHDAYGRLKFESGVHRVQRVPETEASGRIHTSAATVAVLPEAEEVDVQINDADLRIDIFRSGGKGGQNVNKVETAVRIVHIPTGLVVQCQDERSQLKNREKAMKVLRSRLYDMALARQQSEIAGTRLEQIGSGDRSEKIRTYNWPQNRVTDHRLEGESKNHPLESVVHGDLDPIIDRLRMDEQAAMIAAQQGGIL